MVALPNPPAAARFRVIVETETGAREVAARGDRSVHAALVAAGAGLVRAGCENGGCGVCKVAVLEGTWRVVRAMSRAHASAEEQAAGRVLACRIQPTSDLRVRVLGNERRPRAAAASGGAHETTAHGGPESRR